MRIKSHSRLSSRGGFTLVELMVAVGLMAIMLTMIATIFYQSTVAFRSARATMEIHRSARAILNAFENDLSATEYCTYGVVQGYFALNRLPDRDVSDPNMIRLEALTFTTLAPQPGARYAAPEAIQQLALVRYQLEWDGGSVELPNTVPFDDRPLAYQADTQAEYESRDLIQRPTYRLVKRARFPRTDNARLDMEEFDPARLPLEVDPADLNSRTYAIPEPIGFNVLSMTMRLYCRPDKADTGGVVRYFVETGAVQGTAPVSQLTDADTTKDWTPFPNRYDGMNVRIISGLDATDVKPISATVAPRSLTITGTWNTNPNSSSQYWIEQSDPSSPPGAPRWYALDDWDYFGLIDRPPAMVEIALELTDERATKVYTFTERFYIPASERLWTQ